MATAEQMRRACDAYVAAMSGTDRGEVAALYAPDATVEDPVGSEPHVGHEAIRAFYDAVPPVRLEQSGPVCVAEPTWAAFPFTVTAGDGTTRIDVIDVFTFDDDGLVTSMKAYWGPDNVR